MKHILRLEELSQLLFSILLFSQLPYAWWYFPALFLLPDLSMLGYLVNPTVGAYLYNLVHHKGVAIALGAAGLVLHQPVLLLAGVILFGHASFDRLLGFGLKYTTGFKHTHLDTL